MKKAFLHSSCSTFAIKKFKKVPLEEFHFNEIIVLQPGTLPSNELFYNNLSKILIIAVEWYIIMVN